MTQLQNTLSRIPLIDKMRRLTLWQPKAAPLRVSRLAEGEGEAAIVLRTLALRSLHAPRRFRA